jgi:3-deoxy-D-manno-octulosonate 8-phosphate phosphatase (KDO 8-P phosphatase)
LTPEALEARLASIKLLLLDVDGVLTTGQIVYTDDGRELKHFHVRDGAGIAYWLRSGREAAIISGRRSDAVSRRASELGIARVYQGFSSKLAAFRELLRETGRAPAEVCAIGDDLPDLPVFRHVGLGVAVADACPDLRAAAHLTTTLPGGQGAVRVTIDRIMKAQRTWESVIDSLKSEVL